MIMPCCRFTILCLVAILCISLCVGIGSSHVKRCTEIERQALLKLKDGFIHGREALTSWNGEDCCQWKGVSCNNLTGYVTSIDLHYDGYTNGTRSLGGKLDSSICEVKHLTSLNLSYNNLQGKIPKCIGSLGQLVELNLAINELVSPIPPSLGNLTNLQTLDLGENNFVANDLDWLSHLLNLRYLDLSKMNLSQAENWLSSITKIPSLSDLYLDSCGLNQVLLKSIPHINSSTSLKTLFLSSNDLNSSSISWVLNVSKVLTTLDLSDNSLSTIPDGFSSMISLRYLYLSYNEFEGSIPKSIQNLCQLKELDMRSNKLTGQLSENIPQLNCVQQNLESLDLSNNPFSNGLLPNFSWISTLKSLSLGNTNIVGPLPHSIAHFPYLASLEELDLSHNQLKGALPYDIGQLSKLRRLSLSSNKLTGVIRESHLSNLSSLQSLDVAENSLSFNLSSKWVPPFQLDALLASSCNLGPEFPTWLKYQMKLHTLDVSNCGIKDSFPNWFWELSSNLKYLNVSHNILSGALPKSLPSIKSPSLNIWDFSFNKLSGTLSPFPEIYALLLSNNMFSGSLSSFCETSNYLTYLDLSSNLLEGTLLDCWEKFQSLQVLILAKNNLSGTIPKSFGFLPQIESIHLSNNNFFGEIPSLALCSSLAFIDFGDNNLQGTLSTWMVHHLHQLTVLRLQSNQFQGNIPTSLCDMPFLQVLDLSKNNITGEIPQCLNNITVLSNMSFPRKDFLFRYLTFGSTNGHEYEIFSFSNKAIFAWKGTNREYGKNLGYLTSIDLSNNHLTGEIPKSIAQLVALASLNVSGNHLTGFIPNNIGQMKMLESLDLSRNNLSGRMPGSFSNLTYLSYMNLSFNNLYGKIPTGTQLQSFDPSTYMGNNGLCGPPLTNHCLGDVISPTSSSGKHATNEDEDELITFGFYVSLVLGFFVGFWGVCGTLVIKTSWRNAYYQFFNNMNDWVHVTLAVSKARLKRRFHVQD